MKGVSEGKWRWVELQCWFVLSVPATHSFFLNWLIFSLTASDGSAILRRFSLWFLNFQSRVCESLANDEGVQGEKKTFQTKKLFLLS